MSRAVLVLAGRMERQRAHAWIDKAPINARVEFKSPLRSTDQNAKMWACLTDIACQVPWHGLKLTADDWKLIFLDALKAEMRLVPNINGNGFVNLGRSSSDLGKDEMSDLIELILAFGAQHGVTFHDPEHGRTAAVVQARPAAMAWRQDQREAG